MTTFCDNSKMAACKLFLISLLAALIAYVAYFTITANVFGRVYEQRPGNCSTIKMNGSEDIVFLPNCNHSIITSGLQLHTPPEPFHGSLYVMDMNSNPYNSMPVQFEGSYRNDNPYFNPHGLSYWIDESGDTFLYVICHWIGYDSVEVFLYDPNLYSVKFLKSLHSHPLMYHFNNIVAVSRKEFYATNWKYFSNSFLFDIEVIARLPWNIIVYCNIETETCSIASSGLKSCNGINRSRNGKYIYATSSFNEELIAFKRLDDNKLEIVQSIHVPIYVDNINVDTVTGDIWAAVLVKTLEMRHYFKNSSYPIPSQTLHISVNDEDDAPFANTKTEQVFQSCTHGAISSALYVHNKQLLLLGTVSDNMHICRVNFLMF